MAVTFQNLVGTRENLDKTISGLLSTEWDDSNTSSITPDFEDGTSQPDFLARFDRSGANKVYCEYAVRDRTEREDQEALGDSIHMWSARLFIDVFAETLAILTQFEDEINRILWENRPDNNTRLLKTDATASEVELFEQTEINFERIEPDDEEATQDLTPSSQGQLVLQYIKNKT